MVLFAMSLSAHAQVIISEVYGGGGNAGATYKNDFIELYNSGATAVNLNGWSVQYASVSGSSWQVTPLTAVTLQPGQHYLVQEAAGAGGTTNLPTPDAIGSINMSGTGSKVALVMATTPLTGSCPTGDVNLADLVGTGTANCFTGTAAAPATSNTLSAQRKTDGAGIPVNTNDNAADFTTAAPTPQNANNGVDDLPLSVSALSPARNSTGVAASSIFSITFSKPIEAGAGNITVFKKAGNVSAVVIPAASVTINNSTASFAVNGLAAGTAYYITIDSAAIKDTSGVAFKGFKADTSWGFITGSNIAAYSFNSCSPFGSVSDGFTQFNIKGDSIWECTSFGRINTNGLQVNGYKDTADEDWLVSPSLDLTGTTYPLLQYYTITKFAGLPLRLFVSTNYTGGNPSAATWTEVNAKFPAVNSNAWVLCDSINLSAFKTANTHIAWVYYADSSNGAARTTLDDIAVYNSTVKPSPSLNVSPASATFGYVAAGSTSASKKITISGSDFTGDLTVTAPGSFEVSKDNSTFSSSVTIPVSGYQSLYVRFKPAQDNIDYTDSLHFMATGYNKYPVMLSGSSLSKNKTLEVVNWNIEWFGSADPTLGPANKNLQETNVKTVLRYLDADLYAFSEIVDTARFHRVADSLGSDYGYAIANYCSYATNPTAPDYAASYASGQKNGYIYKKSIFSNVTTRGLLRYHASAQQNDSTAKWWASGRFPYLMNADVTVNGITKNINFVVIHAKANTGSISEQIDAYYRRLKGAQELKDTFDAHFAGQNIVLLGDCNDDLYKTIAPAAVGTTSSYNMFVTDSTGAAPYYHSLTLPLAIAGQHSTASNPSVIDNVIVSNAFDTFYVAGSAAIRTEVQDMISSYSSTTSDHYPVFTKYLFNQSTLPLTILQFTGANVKGTAALHWVTAQEINTGIFIIERATGSTWKAIGRVAAKSSITTSNDYDFIDASPATGDNYYRLKEVDKDGRVQYTATIKLNFGNNTVFSVGPNPASDVTTVTLPGNQSVTVDVYSSTGKKVLGLQSASSQVKINVSNLAKGIYYIKATGKTGLLGIRKLVVN